MKKSCKAFGLQYVCYTVERLKTTKAAQGATPAQSVFFPRFSK